MFQKLGEETLKSGERLEIGVVTAPDTEFAEGIQQILGHKNPEWQAHIRAALRGETDQLKTRFYLGLLDGEPVGNIQTLEQHGIGLLGHVFTRPEHRRKGICQTIMSQQMEDFRQRGGHVLLLGTGFERPPYWIYHSFGFRSLKGGFMRYATAPDNSFERDWFAPGPAHIVPAEWRHWPLVALLASLPGREFLRSAAWHLFEIGNVETSYARFITAKAEGKGMEGVVLEKETGAIVGCATLYPTWLWSGGWPNVWLVDVFTHPDFSDRTADLVNALPTSPGKLIAYVDTQAAEKAAALESCGFAREGTLRRFLRVEETPRDVWLYGKEV